MACRTWNHIESVIIQCVPSNRNDITTVKLVKSDIELSEPDETNEDEEHYREEGMALSLYLI
jgi:hypothetical protein